MRLSAPNWGHILSRGVTWIHGRGADSCGDCSPVGVLKLLKDAVPGSGFSLGLSNVICLR